MRTRAAGQDAAEQDAVAGAGAGDHTRAPLMILLLVVVVTLVSSTLTTFLLRPLLLP